MKWLEAFLVQNLWLTLLIWAALYVLDYVQTLRGARLYHQVAKQHTVFEGSYELTPYFQPDIDQLRRFSFRLLLMVLTSLILLIVIWWLASLVGVLELFSVAAGGLILRSLVVHYRHIRNIASFEYVQRNAGQIKGRIEYSRSLLLWNSAVDLGAFAGLFLILFGLTGSWFVAGGSLGCAASALRMVLYSRKTASNATGTAQTNETHEPLAQ